MIMFSSLVFFNAAIQLYEIHILIILSSSFPGIYLRTIINHQLSAGSLAQLVRALHWYRNLLQKQIK